MPLKLGEISKKIPYAAAYLGEKLVYQKTKEQAFSECPFPTSWDVVTTGTEYTSENDYGAWKITASEYSSNFSVVNAFDNDSSSDWRPTALSSISDYAECCIECPDGKVIKPFNITLIHRNQGNTTNYSVLKGFNIETEEWEDLHTLTRNVSIQEETVDILTENYYSKFKIVVYRYSAGYPYPYLFEFKINSGMIKNI